MKFTKDEIGSILEKAVGTALQGSAPQSDAGDVRITNLEKNVSGIANQISKIAELASTGFEKPKSMEDMFKEMSDNIDKKIEKAIKASKGEADENEPIPQTKGEMKKMLEDTIAGILDKKVQKKNDPKGKGKDSLEKTIDELGDEDVQKLVDDAVEDVEEEDSMGNPLSKKARANRAALDKHLGKIMSQSRSRFVGEDEGGDDEGGDEGDDE